MTYDIAYTRTMHILASSIAKCGSSLLSLRYDCWFSSYTSEGLVAVSVPKRRCPDIRPYSPTYNRIKTYINDYTLIQAIIHHMCSIYSTYSTDI